MSNRLEVCSTEEWSSTRSGFAVGWCVAAWNDEFVPGVKTTCSPRVPDDSQLTGWYSYLLVQDLVQKGKSRDPPSFF